jgi:hypothetical protein
MTIGASNALKLALIVPALVLAGCATASRPHHPASGSASSLAGQACSEIMGLRPGAEHVACSGRLSRYSETLRADAAFIQSEGDSLLPSALPAKYYLHMNAQEQRQRAELSCARIGLQPGWAGFGSCVHSLNYAISDAKNWPGP